MYENTAEAPKERETRIDRVAGRVNECIERIGRSTDELESFADRLIGSVPEESSGGQVAPCSTGKIGTIEDQVNRVEQLAARLEGLCGRLYDAA